jgi:hypothetical protein
MHALESLISLSKSSKSFVFREIVIFVFHSIHEIGLILLYFHASVFIVLYTMEHIKVYFQESTIHGFPWIVNRNLHIVEKVLWIISLLFSFVCCGLLIYEIGAKYQEDAIVTYTSDTAIDVTDVSLKV